MGKRLYGLVFIICVLRVVEDERGELFFAHNNLLLSIVNITAHNEV